eukprot:476893_1
MPLAFRTKKSFKRLFANANQWQWTIYEYQATKASTSIEQSQGLQAYIDASVSSIRDNEGNEKYLKLRIVFHRIPRAPRQPVIHNVSNAIPCDTCGQNIPFYEYDDHQFAHSIGSTYVIAPEGKDIENVVLFKEEEKKL